MPIFKKKKKEVKSEIPETPGYGYPEHEIEEMPSEHMSDLPELPEMPSAELPELPQMMEDGISREEKKKVKKLPKKLTQEIGIRKALPKGKGRAKIITAPKKAEETKIRERPIFIKIDKFKEILASVDTIEKRIAEISQVIKKLKDIRTKEEDEMDRWEAEIEEIKERLEAIEQTLSKVET